MKSNAMKVLRDNNGNKYRFSSEKFHLALSNKKENDRQNDIKSSMSILKRAIAERCYITEEAVKKWESGHNGPSSMDQVMISAEVLGVPYTELLDSVKKTDENSSVSVKNRQLIDTIFRESLTVLMQKAKFNTEVEDRCVRRTQFKKNRQDTIERLQNLVGEVDGYALSTSPFIRSTLKRILIEMQTLVDDRVPEMWHDLTEDAGSYESGIVFAYYGSDRNAIFNDDEIIARAYLFDEIDFADELGLDDVRYLDDEFDKIDDFHEYASYGYQGELNITPDMVYGYCLSNYLKKVFMYYFPTEIGEC